MLFASAALTAAGMIPCTEYVRVRIEIGPIYFRTCFRVVPMAPSAIFGCPWLARFNPHINWRDHSKFEIEFQGKRVQIQVASYALRDFRFHAMSHAPSLVIQVQEKS